MKKMIFAFVLLVLTSIGFGQTKTFYLNSQQKNCTIMMPMKCLQYKEKKEDSWKLMYQSIEGFTFEEGYLYKIKVNQVRVANHPADGSSIRYVLKKVISKEKYTKMEVQLSNPPNGKYKITGSSYYAGKLKSLHYSSNPKRCINYLLISTSITSSS